MYHPSRLVEFTASQSQVKSQESLLVTSFSFLSLSRFLFLSLIVVPSRYFQCQPRYGLFAPVHKVTKIGFPSTTPAKAQAAAARRVMATTPASLKRSPSASSLSSMSSVAASVSSKASRTGLVSLPSRLSLHSRHGRCPPPPSARLLCFRKGYTSPRPCMKCSFAVACERSYTFRNKREPKPLAQVQV